MSWPRTPQWSNQKILVLGDSHANVFRDWRLRVWLPRVRFCLKVVGGATVSGLENPNSKTQAGSIFHEALSSGAWDHIVTLLGEVDTGFVIWYSASKNGVPVAEYLQRAVDRYRNLLSSCVKIAPTTVISAPLPTIPDGQTWGEVANLRREVTASQEQRTTLTLEFNRRVAEVAHSIGVGFISLDAQSLGPHGLVSKLLVNANQADHHYTKSRYAKLLLPHLVDALKLGRVSHSLSSASFAGNKAKN